MWKRKNKQDTEIQIAGRTDVGRIRTNNEDFFLIEPNNKGGKTSPYLLCLVADGMGGQDYGEIASQTVAAAFHERLGDLNINQDVKEWLESTGKQANAAVREQHHKYNPGNGMGSTLVGGLFLHDRCYFCNVGDSRAYLFREGSLARITNDHSLVEILLNKGLITKDEVYTHPRRGELARYMGQPEDLKVDIFEVITQKDDVILICSDGLWEMVRDHEIASVLATDENPAVAAEKLIYHANQNGGTDNITAIVARVVS